MPPWPIPECAVLMLMDKVHLLYNRSIIHVIQGPSAESEDDNSASGGEEEMAYVGAPKYGVKLSKVILDKILKSSKTPEKLALNLITPVLSDYEISNCTLYGNDQFKKGAVDDQKRKAIRCAVFEKAGESSKEEKEELWKKLTVRINNKIRGLKNGKYKKQ
ncbi:unnamed protein product [Mytilus edulis]|uniref:BEN domain-containing protein n=1 Tax=Mytilus edulis TaxID=6550 RepID=A0A8S3TSN3_MYTED|nr:unnamed protein product [Mytilus edulis]